MAYYWGMQEYWWFFWIIMILVWICFLAFLRPVRDTSGSSTRGWRHLCNCYKSDTKPAGSHMRSTKSVAHAFCGFKFEIVAMGQGITGVACLRWSGRTSHAR